MDSFSKIVARLYRGRMNLERSVLLDTLVRVAKAVLVLLHSLLCLKVILRYHMTCVSSLATPREEAHP